jgi:long-chain acyl-CoA synthetase
VLHAHPDIVEAAVVGIPSPNGGESVIAAVIMRPGAELDEVAMRAWCKERLAAYKVPRQIIAMTELPRSILGKVIRKQVREVVAPHSPWRHPESLGRR